MGRFVMQKWYHVRVSNIAYMEDPDFHNSPEVLQQQKVFGTHYNYVLGLETLTRALSIDAPINQAKIIHPGDVLRKKVKLIKATREILNAEHGLAIDDADFASAFCGWLPAKIYYLLFHCWCIVDYLITTENRRINSDHQALWNSLNEKIETGRIVFSESTYNQISTVQSAMSYSATTGDNLRFIQDKDELRKIRTAQILKKISDYKLESAKHRGGINSFVGFKGRRVKQACEKEKISLLEFFYQYRLKTNYRDLSFLGDHLSPEDAYKFFHSYIKLGKNHYEAVRSLINKLAEQRFSQKIL